DLVLEDIRSGGSPSKILRKVFIKRLHANPSYSVRKFAKDLGMGQTLLNHVFSGKRGVSCSQGIRLAPRLGLRSPEKEEWLRVVLASLPKKAKERQRLEAALNGVVPEEMEFLTSAYERVE